MNSLPWHRLTPSTGCKGALKIALILFMVWMHLLRQILIRWLLLNHVREMRSRTDDWLANVSARRRHIYFLGLISPVCLSLTSHAIDIHRIGVISLMVTISHCKVEIGMLLFSSTYVRGDFRWEDNLGWLLEVIFTALSEWCWCISCLFR